MKKQFLMIPFFAVCAVVLAQAETGDQGGATAAPASHPANTALSLAGAGSSTNAARSDARLTVNGTVWQLGGSYTVSTANKVGIIHIQKAIVETKDGQKAAADLQAKFEPKRKELEGLKQQIDGLQAQLRNGSNTMSDEAKSKLIRNIDENTKSLNRKQEDAQAELDQEQQRILNDLGGKLMVVIQKYAQDHGYTLILDVSNPQGPVLYAANGIDITKDIIDLYDKNAPSKPTASTPAASKQADAPASSAPAKKPAPSK
jgi:outer membrane protein